MLYPLSYRRAAADPADADGERQLRPPPSVYEDHSRSESLVQRNMRDASRQPNSWASYWNERVTPPLHVEGILGGSISKSREGSDSLTWI